MLRNIPQPGEIYKHFKGTEYRIIGVAKTKKFNAFYVPAFSELPT